MQTPDDPSLTRDPSRPHANYAARPVSTVHQQACFGTVRAPHDEGPEGSRYRRSGDGVAEQCERDDEVRVSLLASQASLHWKAAQDDAQLRGAATLLWLADPLQGMEEAPSCSTLCVRDGDAQVCRLHEHPTRVEEEIACASGRTVGRCDVGLHRARGAVCTHEVYLQPSSNHLTATNVQV
jgi:hypothetical protein